MTRSIANRSVFSKVLCLALLLCLLYPFVVSAQESVPMSGQSYQEPNTLMEYWEQTSVTLKKIGNISSQLVKGLGISLQIFFLTLAFALPLGLITALLRMSKNWLISGIARIHISILRGTPLMLQLLMVYFGPYYLFGMSLKHYPPFMAVIIAFSVNYSAYFAEIFRGGIQSISKGQYEAAEVLGYTRRQTFFKIILPQVIKRILPPVTNEIITLVKDTSLAQVIAVAEMFTLAKRLANAQSSLLALVTAGIFYYVFNFIVAMFMEKMESKLNYYR